jgi:hypothetical protein
LLRADRDAARAPSLAVHVATDGRCQRGEIVRGLYLVDEPAPAIAELGLLLVDE